MERSLYQGAGNCTCMQRRLPLLCESFVSLHPQAPPLPPPALQWESLQVLTLSGGGQSQGQAVLSFPVHLAPSYMSAVQQQPVSITTLKLPYITSR
ncbi:hypothetical protein INR49_016964 [Caranx melampygus]|nr:hypothetical protein INR49_016964 [Caranx melampygus]